MDINGCRDGFLEFIQYEKRVSKHTLVAYSNDIKQFVTYLSTTYEIKKIAEEGYPISVPLVVEIKTGRNLGEMEEFKP